MDGEHQEMEQNGMGKSTEHTGTDEESRKLFIGGLPPVATKDDVQSYFSQFGEVEMCTIKTDVYTGRSRGFGFLIFKTVDAVNQVLNKSDGHEIAGKKVDPKLATPQSNRGENEEKSTKVFVGGIEKGTSKDDITAAFSERGNVVDVYLPIDKATGEQKGFAFVNFDDSKLAETLCSEGKITINGKECDVKKATNKNDANRGRGGFRGGFRGGRGGGRGGWGGNFYGGGYDQYGGGYGYGGGYNNYGGGGFDQYGGGYGGSGGSGGYLGGYGGAGYEQYGSGGGGYEQSSYGYNSGDYGGGYGHGQGNKMKGGRGRGGSFQPY